MKLRNFLYLNENILDDYLSALEGSLTEKIITKEKMYCNARVFRV